MLITIDWLKEKGACAESLLAFKHRFPNGAEYQEVLDALAAEDRYDWGSWLLRVGGNTNAILEVDELITEASIFFAGKIIVKGILKTTKWLLSGGGIEAGESIEAGWDFGIYAGLKIRISLKSQYAIVRAKTEPKDLLLGTFEKIEEKDQKESGNDA